MDRAQDNTESASLQHEQKQKRQKLETVKPSTIFEICLTQSATTFEGDILVTYGPTCKDNSSAEQRSSIAHMDLIDRDGQRTITVNITNKLINKYLHWLTPGTSSRLDNFEIRKKIAFERGDADYSLQVTSDTKIEKVSTVCKQQRLMPDTTISKLVHSQNAYPIGTLGVLVASHHQDATHIQLQIRDGKMPYDIATFAIPKVHNLTYNKMQKILTAPTTNTPLLLLLKNVVRSGPRGSATICSSLSTFIDILNDEYSTMQLHTVASSHLQVTGILKTKNVHSSPYQPLCTQCQHIVSITSITKTTAAHYTKCGKTTTFTFQPFLQCTIETEDDIIECSLHGQLLQQHFSELYKLQFKNYTENISRAGHLMRAFEVHGTFTLAMDHSIKAITQESTSSA